MVTFDAHLLMLDDVTVGSLIAPELEFLASPLQHFEQPPKEEQMKIQNWPPFSITTRRRPTRKTALKTVLKKWSSNFRVGICCHWNARRTQNSSFFLPLKRLQCRNAHQKWQLEYGNSFVCPHVGVRQCVFKPHLKPFELQIQSTIIFGKGDALAWGTDWFDVSVLLLHF